MTNQVTINQRTGSFERGESLFDIGESLGVAVPSSCRGHGTCRECIMEILGGEEGLTAPVEAEAHLPEDFRLSCCARLTEATVEVRAQTMRRAEINIEDKAMNLPAAAALANPDPAITRNGDRVYCDGIEIAQHAGSLLGLAVDIGTTTIVVRAVDLESGQIVASTSLENPQRFGGSDVMSRIQYDTDYPGQMLQRTLISYLTRALHQMPIQTEDIFEIVVVGNPTMRDLFLGLEVHSIGQRPYQSLTEKAWRQGEVESSAVTLPAQRLRLPAHPTARVYALPIVASHVGGDAAACLLAVAGDRRNKLIAMMDIGTNTEVFLGTRERMLAASCPAGPAFEGRTIIHGMPGLTGAIEKVRITTNGEMQFQVIGGGKPEGICGSGLISLLAELKRTHRMNTMGRFEHAETSLLLDPESKVDFRESDVNELAQAKGANVAGLRIISQTYGRSLSEVDVFYLAGGFGRHIDLDDAREIGLIPDLPDDKIVRIGNAAVEGATLALLSGSRRRQMEEFVKGIEHVELETNPHFFDHFVEGCLFQRFAPDSEGEFS